MPIPISGMIVYIVACEKDTVAVFSTRENAENFIEEMIHKYNFNKKDFVVNPCIVDRKLYT